MLTSQSTLMPYEASMLMSLGSVESTDVLDGANTREIDASVLQMVLRDFSPGYLDERSHTSNAIGAPG